MSGRIGPQLTSLYGYITANSLAVYDPVIWCSIISTIPVGVAVEFIFPKPLFELDSTLPFTFSGPDFTYISGEYIFEDEFNIYRTLTYNIDVGYNSSIDQTITFGIPLKRPVYKVVYTTITLPAC